jgi:hypothetical protein
MNYTTEELNIIRAVNYCHTLKEEMLKEAIKQVKTIGEVYVLMKRDEKKELL